jgi:hypothetical protein
MNVKIYTYFKYLIIAFLTALFYLIILFLTTAYAEELVEGNSSSTLSSISTTTNELPWFRLEKLEGDNFSQGDFVVGPGRVEIEGKPGETIIKEISVTNRISNDRTFELSVEDISGSQDSDTSVVLLGNEKGPYTLKDYVSFPQKTFKLNLGERAWIPVSITIPKNAEPGGLYGSVLISTLSSAQEGNEGVGTRSPVIARVGTLFFVTVPGDVKKDGSTKEVALSGGKWWYEKGPIKFHILFENEGSVHLNPYGEMRVKNIFGEEVGFVDLEPWFALPKSLRTRDVTWDREMLFGRYTATAQINRGYDDIVDEVSVNFWVLPWKVVGGLFLFIFISILTVRAFFRSFEFKRRS